MMMKESAAILLLAGTLSVFFACTSEAQVAEEIRYQPATVSITAPQLYAEYQTNGIAAEQMYEGKVLEITGVVRSSGEDITGTPYVILASGGLGGIQCLFADDQINQLAQLSTGQPITLRGKVDGLLIYVFVHGCAIVSERNLGRQPSSVSGRTSKSTPAGPFIVANDASMFAPSIDYFGLGWRKQEPVNGPGDSLLSRHIQSFVTTQPPTSVTIDISVFAANGPAVESFTDLENRHSQDFKGRPGIGDTGFRVKTEHLATLLETVIMRRHNIVVEIKLGRNGYSLLGFDVVELAKYIDKKIVAAPLVAAQPLTLPPTPTSIPGHMSASAPSIASTPVTRFTGSGKDALAAEIETVQTAMDAMMAEQNITTVDAKTSLAGINTWTVEPTGTGSAFLDGYMRENTTRYYYCWKRDGQVYAQNAAANTEGTATTAATAGTCFAPAGLTE